MPSSEPAANLFPEFDFDDVLPERLARDIAEANKPGPVEYRTPLPKSRLQIADDVSLVWIDQIPHEVARAVHPGYEAGAMAVQYAWRKLHGASLINRTMSAIRNGECQAINPNRSPSLLQPNDPCTTKAAVPREFVQSLLDELLKPPKSQRSEPMTDTSNGQATAATAEPQAEDIRKRETLISELEPEWKSIERDLRDASRNGLSRAKVPNRQGYWFVEQAKRWARENGKMRSSIRQPLAPPADIAGQMLAVGTKRHS